MELPLQGIHCLHMLRVIMPEKRQVQIAEKGTQYNLRIISKSHACLQAITKTPVKFQKNQHKTVGGVAHTRYPIFNHLNGKIVCKMTEFNLRKSDKNNLRIISKPHAYVQTMSKTPVKFQKNRNKTVGLDAHTRYPLSIHFDSKNEKWLKLNLRKKVIKII